MELKIEVSQVQEKIILRLSGRIDTATAPILEKKIDSIINETNNILILDFSNVYYLSSAGLRILISSSKKLKIFKGHLILFALNDDLMEIIKMAGFEKILNIRDIEEEALNFK